MQNYNYFKNFNNKNTSRFYNLKNLFTFRSLFILIITLILTFSVRWFIVNYFNYDLYTFKDFFFIGIIVSFIRPLIMDLFDIFYPKIDLSVASLSEALDLPNSNISSRNQHDRCVQTQLNVSSSNGYIDSYNTDFKYKVKCRLLWVVWKWHSDEFDSFKDFKNSIRGEFKIRSEIKKDLEKELPGTFRRLRKAK
jgi:hypothetical protein